LTFELETGKNKGQITVVIGDRIVVSQILDFARCRAEKLYQQAVELEQEGDLDEALALLEQVIGLDQTHADAHLALSFHYRRVNRIEEAIEQCRKSLDITPSAEGFFSLGQALIDKNEHTAAMQALRRCLDLDPSMARAQYKIAFVYYLRGEYDVAITEFHRAAQIEPDWETYFFLGECYRLTHRCPEAERMLRKAMPLAGSWGQVELTKSQLACVARLSEFSGDDDLTVKDRYYADSGVVYLGTAQDDGLQVHPYFFYHFSYRDLAVTLKRLLALIEAARWQFDAVAPVDIVSLPLALALARRHHLLPGCQLGGRLGARHHGHPHPAAQLGPLVSPHAPVEPGKLCDQCGRPTTARAGDGG
jgi:tetratricopeptide (TPR) repeat protein